MSISQKAQFATTLDHFFFAKTIFIHNLGQVFREPTYIAIDFMRGTIILSALPNLEYIYFYL